MGLDAPPGKRDDRNRERITLVADESGGSYIRFLDRTTSIPARLYLDDQNPVWLEFTGAQANEIVRRRIGLSGDERLVRPDSERYNRRYDAERASEESRTARRCRHRERSRSGICGTDPLCD